MLTSVRRWHPGWPCPVAEILAPHRRGTGDPTFRATPDGAVWRGLRTPEGAASVRIEARPSEREVLGQGWGPGADWALDRLPAMLGADDDWTGFVAGHPVLERARARHPHWRVGRTDLVLEALVPAILEQKVTGQEAFTGFRRLVRRFGEPAPGADGTDLWVQPTAADLRTIPSWEWLRLPVDPGRSRTVVGAAARAPALERTTRAPADVADRQLRSLPGVGVWTSAEVRARAYGDPDAVSFGDYHLPSLLGWALTGTPVDDAGLERLLRPWAGHRYRVQQLVRLAGPRPQRRGPRMAPRQHLPGPG